MILQASTACERKHLVHDLLTRYALCGYPAPEWPYVFEEDTRYIRPATEPTCIFCEGFVCHVKEQPGGEPGEHSTFHRGITSPSHNLPGADS